MVEVFHARYHEVRILLHPLHTGAFSMFQGIGEFWAMGLHHQIFAPISLERNA
jgi:hypothetical protein